MVKSSKWGSSNKATRNGRPNIAANTPPMNNYYNVTLTYYHFLDHVDQLDQLAYSLLPASYSRLTTANCL